MKRIACCLLALLALKLPLNGDQNALNVLKKPPSQQEKQNEEGIVLFTPPAGWNLVESGALPPTVKVMVVGKGAYPFRPSMNLSTEPYKGTLKQYLKIVKGMNESQGYNWKDLGTIRTEAGVASLSQVDTKSEWGDVRLMHVILLKNGRIFILTSSALKEEFSKFYKDFFNSMRSLRVNNNIFDTITDSQRKAQLKTAYQNLQIQWKNVLAQKQKEQSDVPIERLKEETFKSEQFQSQNWNAFKDMINQKYSDMGADWQKLALQQFENDLLTTNP